MFRQYFRIAGLLVAALGWTACGGGGSSGAGPTTAALPPAAQAPSASLTYTLSSTGSTEPLPSAGAYGGSVSFPPFNVAPGATIVATASTASTATSAALRRTTATGSLNVYYAVTFTPSRTVTFPGVPAFTVQLPPEAKPAGQRFFYAISQPSSGPFATFRTEGPAAISGSTLIFPASVVPLTLEAGVPYTFAFYGVAAATAPTSLVYAAIAGTNVVAAYPSTASGDIAPVRAIVGPHTQLRSPGGIAHDGAGRIYVANAGSNSITEYASDADGDAPPLRTIHVPGTLTLTYVAVDAAGEIYAGISGAQVAIVMVFAPSASGDAAPIRTIATGSADDNGGLALDAAGDLVVGVDHDVPPPSTRTIDVFAPDANGLAAPLRSIAGPNTTLGFIGGLAIGPDGTIYTPNVSAPLAAIDAFGAHADGNVAPIAVLQGAQTRLALPTSIAVDDGGVVYVANSLSASSAEIDAFAAPAVGNVAPLTVIAGPHTGLNAGPGSLMILPRALAYP